MICADMTDARTVSAMQVYENLYALAAAYPQSIARFLVSMDLGSPVDVQGVPVEYSDEVPDGQLWFHDLAGGVHRVNLT